MADPEPSSTPRTPRARSLLAAGAVATAVLAAALVSVTLPASAATSSLTADAAPGEPSAPGHPPMAAAAAPTVIAAVSDFGYDHENALTLADMVDGWDPDYVITTGDNVQTADIPGSGTDKYDYAVGRLFCRYLKGAASGPRCPSGGSADRNRFFPAAGNHDHDDGPISAYLSYFDLPGPGTTRTSTTGSELYYDVVLGDLHLFVIDSDTLYFNTPDAAPMMAWLEREMSASTAAWQVVTVHEPAWGSSADYGSRPYIQHPYHQWGADLVLNGHAAVYERVLRNGINYVTNGLGGGAPTAFGTPVAGSQVRINSPIIAGVRLRVTERLLQFEMVDSGGTVRDSFDLSTTPPVSIQTTALPAGRVGDSYSGTLTATGGTGPYTWARVGGDTLPSGLSLNGSTGVVSGTPSTAGTRSVRVRATDSDGKTAERDVTISIAEGAAGGTFVGVGPSRRLDTRTDGGCLNGSRTLPVAGIDGVPSDAAAVALNVTVTAPRSPGYLTVHPAGTPRPTASSLNFVGGETGANLVTARLGDGGVTLFASGGCPHVVVDVAGYYTGGDPARGGLVGASSPIRLLDTRASGTCLSGSLDVPVAGVSGIPADASAVSLNVTVTSPSAAGYLTVHPTGTARPVASSLNYSTGRTVPNHVTARVGSGGSVRLFASGGCPHVVVDLAGHYTAGPADPGGFVGTTPERVFDSRRASDAPCVSGVRSVAVAPTGGGAGAAAVALNVTVTGASAPGYVTVYPGDASRPTASNVNHAPGHTVANAAITRVGADGTIKVFASGGCPHVIVDIAGHHRR